MDLDYASAGDEELSDHLRIDEIEVVEGSANLSRVIGKMW